MTIVLVIFGFIAGFVLALFIHDFTHKEEEEFETIEKESFDKLKVYTSELIKLLTNLKSQLSEVPKEIETKTETSLKEEEKKVENNVVNITSAIKKDL
jgi:hypothetical protein